MPDMNGLELAKKARALSPDLHIIRFTGNSAKEVMRAIDDHGDPGISGIYQKPGGVHDLLTCILNS